MDSNLARMVSTVVIWTGLTIMAITGMITGAFIDFWMALLVVGAATVATTFIWGSGRASSADINLQNLEKQKREDKVERVLNKLSKAELAELRARLSESDGELLTLEELVEEQERRTRGY
ncbi:MAG TPA: hypothetical protein VHO69_11410 [Phototrophicaceae bacterium]|nr:hypothetical protein [Phototrophicaceae bacterium]